MHTLVNTVVDIIGIGCNNSRSSSGAGGVGSGNRGHPNITVDVVDVSTGG